MMFKTIIIDDEPLAHDVIKEHTSKILSISNVANFFNAKDALSYLAHNSIDIIFVDIQMPEVNGISFLKQLPSLPIVIFTTAYRDYAFEGYELGVMDYLLKPISFDRFSMAVSKVVDFLNLKKNGDELYEKNNIPVIKSFSIKSGTKHISLPLDTISHIQGLKDYVIFYADKQKYVVKGYIKLIVDILPAGYFTRVHKSFIVANDKIKLINRGRIEFDTYQIPIGRIYKLEVEKLFTGK